MGPSGDGRRTPPVEPVEESPPPPHPEAQGEVPATPPLTIRPARGADAAEAAVLHAGQISQGFLSALGPRFLERLYRRVTLSAGSFVLVAESRGSTVGFIAGSTDVAGLYRRFLWRDGIPAALRSAGRLVTGWRKVLDTLGHGAPSGDGKGRGAELLAIAVEPNWQGRGVGRELVASFLQEVEEGGFDTAHVVVGSDNHGAVALYERAGFVVAERFELHSGTESLLMQWERPLPSDPSGPDRP